MPKNIFAWTAPGADFPAYFSINRVDGRLEIVMRSSKENKSTTAIVELPPEVYEDLKKALQNPESA